MAFLGLLCKFFPEQMRKYADPVLLGQYLKYLHEQVETPFSPLINRISLRLVSQRCCQV